MIANKQFSASRASRLDSILQKKKRIPTFEKREELRKRNSFLDIAEIPEEEFKSDDAHAVKQSASSELLVPKQYAWNKQDNELIDWITQNWCNDLFPNSGREVWEKFQSVVADGPHGIEAESLRRCLKFLKEKIETYTSYKKDEQIAPKNETIDLHKQNTYDHGELFECDQIYSWTQDDQQLIDWFLTLTKDQLPTVPFLLSPGVTVVSSKFYDQLRIEISLGSNSPRARTGALQYDLESLRKMLANRDN